MARYLQKFVGEYRVKACYDLDTNDYPRLEDGTLDPSFDDLYIPCKANCVIRHAYQDNLDAYIPSLKRGNNLIKNIRAKYGENIIYDVDETSEEIVFYFKANDIEKIAEFMQPMTNGKDTSPFSKKNLPKAKYTIPEKDLEKYKEIIKDIPKTESLRISRISDKFDAIIQKKMGKKYDVKVERKKAMLKQKEFVHKIGLWSDYIEFMQKHIKEIYNDN